MQIIELQKPLKVTVTTDGGTLQGVAYMFRGGHLEVGQVMIYTVIEYSYLVQLPDKPLQWFPVSALRIDSPPEPCDGVEHVYHWHTSCGAYTYRETTKEEVRAMITLLRSMPHEGQQSVIHALEVWLETEPVQ